MRQNTKTFDLMKIVTLPCTPYTQTFQKMKAFTAERTAETEDELWILEHPPVFTLGRHSDSSHLLKANDIELVQTDRGGQVTYHGPGQLVIYTLIDLKRAGTGPKALVCAIEQSTIQLLKELNIDAHTIEKQPGIYVDNRKIASLGLRIKQGCSYHGLSLNVDMDLTPFSFINPCGIQNLEMTQICDETTLPAGSTLSTLARRWIQHFEEQFNG